MRNSAIAVMIGLSAALFPLTAVQAGSDVATTNWTGIYIGAHGGGVVDGDAHWDYTGIFPAVPQFGDEIDGSAFGMHAGYNLQFNNFVVGVEGDYDLANIDGSEPCENDPTFACSMDIDRVYSVRGRLGYAFDSLMIYGTAGWSWAEVSVDAVQPGISFAAEGTVDGFVYGGGAEMKLARFVSVGVEALHYDFDDTVKPWIATGCCGGGNIGQQNYDSEMTVVRGRLTLHFDRDEHHEAPLK